VTPSGAVFRVVSNILEEPDVDLLTWGICSRHLYFYEDGGSKLLRIIFNQLWDTTEMTTWACEFCLVAAPLRSAAARCGCCSNLVGGLDFCLWWMLCVMQIEASATGRSLVQGRPTDCVCVWSDVTVTVYTNDEYVKEVRLKKKKKGIGWCKSCGLFLSCERLRELWTGKWVHVSEVNRWIFKFHRGR
jgi:hypothetical protein